VTTPLATRRGIAISLAACAKGEARRTRVFVSKHQSNVSAVSSRRATASTPARGGGGGEGDQRDRGTARFRDDRADLRAQAGHRVAEVAADDERERVGADDRCAIALGDTAIAWKVGENARA